MSGLRARYLALCIFLFSLLIGTTTAATNATDKTNTTSGIQWVEYTQPNGQVVWLEDNRRPALYTGAFGDCAGGSPIHVSRFDAAYYKDNMTVLFHIAGSTQLTNVSLMLSIGVYAYGENRFNLTFNPCDANIASLCHLNASVPIVASGIIPVAPSDVAGIIPIALTIPDFEGEAILRIFSNSTQAQIGCFSAVVTNGASFSQPGAVGTALGICTLIALIVSVSTTVYGESVPNTRNHYAHSVSVLVVFSVFHHIYFTGALSMNWPSVLVAFWNNYAWSAGMIHSSSMQASIANFLHGNFGNISIIGSEPSGIDALGLGGGVDSSEIYPPSSIVARAYSALSSRSVGHALQKRGLANSSSGFSWYGGPVKSGMPIPGNYSGFAGTLAEQGIPTAAAFLTGLIWFMVLFGLIGFLMIAFKFTLEALRALRVVKSDRLDFFRHHWLTFVGAALLRTCFIAFFMLAFLTIFQFAFGGPSAVIAIAAITFIVFVLGMLGVGAYAIVSRLRHTSQFGLTNLRDAEHKKFGFIPWHSGMRSESDLDRYDQSGALDHVHDDEAYIKRFGWLTARFRRSKWWFFSFWLAYEFIRACFYGAAARSPLTQVFGLLVVEIIALLTMIFMRPFQSNRLNIVMIYLLGFSKVATLALSAAFIERFNQPRILTTVIGIVIIVIQGLLTVCLLIAIATGAITSYMSLNRYTEEFYPESWRGGRIRFLKHVDQKATDLPPPPPPPKEDSSEPTTPYFSVATVRREPKIEEPERSHNEKRTEEFVDASERPVSLPRAQSMKSERASPQEPRSHSRTQSMRSTVSLTGLPYGARTHRASWSAKDFQDQMDTPPDMPIYQMSTHQRMSMESVRQASLRHRASSLKGYGEHDQPVFPPSPQPDEGQFQQAQPRSQLNKRHSTGPYGQRPRLPRQSSTVNEENEGAFEEPAPNSQPAQNGNVQNAALTAATRAVRYA